MKEITESQLEIVNKVTSLGTYEYLKGYIQGHTNVLSDFLNETSDINIKAPQPENDITVVLDRLWKLISNLSVRDGEMLEFVSDVYYQCITIKHGLNNNLINVKDK